MKKRILLFAIVTSNALFVTAQTWQQYFDGADTLPANSIIVKFDSDTSNIWQIGKPQKSIFDSAATQPNAIVTDTVNSYPAGNVSRFSFALSTQSWGWAILALQWKQKIEIDSASAGGTIEYSVDSGLTWTNVFNDPFVYNFYGFDVSDTGSLYNGMQGFRGTDTVWKDIWLCYDLGFIGIFDTIEFRFTFQSDSIEESGEGWLIDNFLAHETFIHTISAKEQEDYLSVFPSVTNGFVNISAKKIDEFHIIEKLELLNIEGKTINSWDMVPVKFWIDISDQPAGNYFLRIRTNLKEETFKIQKE